MQEESTGHGAALTAVAGDADGELAGPVEIGVGEDEGGRLAAELEDERGQGVGRGRLDAGSDRPATYEADLVDAGVPGQRVPGLGPARAGC